MQRTPHFTCGQGVVRKTRTMTRIAGTVAGSPAYMAPDMRDADQPAGPKADVFSAGIVMIEVASGRQPNPGPEMRRRMVVLEEERRAAEEEQRKAEAAQPPAPSMVRAEACGCAGPARVLVRQPCLVFWLSLLVSLLLSVLPLLLCRNTVCSRHRGRCSTISTRLR